VRPIRGEGGGRAGRRYAAGRAHQRVWMGTHVVSGTATAWWRPSARTRSSARVRALTVRPAETDFEASVRRFGFFLMEVTSLLVIGDTFGHQHILSR